jgi:cytochrome c556
MRLLPFIYALAIQLFPSSCLLAADANEAATDAIQAALARNIDHAKEWLDQKDYKSVAQSAGGLQLLADLLKARGDGAGWQGALDHVLSAAGAVQTAARDEDAAKCKTAMESLQKASQTAAALKPTGKSQSLSRTPPIRSLMLTLDALQGDAKVAVLTGDAAAAKKQAYVLAELGKLLSSARNTEQWSSLAGDFVNAATAAATSNDSDPKAVRQSFRGIAEKCEACHEKNRTR